MREDARVRRALSFALAVVAVVAGAPAAFAQPMPPPASSPAPLPSQPSDLGSTPVATPGPASPAPVASPETPPSAIGSPSAAPLALAKTRLQINPGGSSTVAITGGTPPYAVTFGTPAPAGAVAGDATSPLGTATIDPVARTLVVRAAPVPPAGVRPPAGTTTLTVTDAAGASIPASLLVGPSAGFVPGTVALALVGDPSPDFATVQIGAAIRRAANALPGAGVVVGAPQGLPAALTAGRTLAVPVKVHIDGAGRYVDVDGTATVRLATSAANPIDATTLFYSDDPENVKADGILFRGAVAAGRPARLYYYHQALTPGHQIAIVLDTPSGSAQVTVVGHGAGPNPAVFFVGQNATYRYLDDRARGAGVSLDVPIGAPVVIGAGDGPLNVRDLVAGIFDIAVTSGDPVRLTVLSYAPGVDPRSLLEGSELPTDGYRRRGEYDLSQTAPIVLTERLPAAGTAPSPEPTALVSDSGSALANLRPGGRALGGDYGLLHPVTLTLGNDGDAPGTLYLYEQPIVGYPVTTTIAFAGDPMPTKLQCVKTRTNRYLVRAFTVAPHATQTVSASYMTDGGSTYPLAFGLTTTPPSPLPLTMTEADGCFPKPQ